MERSTDYPAVCTGFCRKIQLAVLQRSIPKRDNGKNYRSKCCNNWYDQDSDYFASPNINKSNAREFKSDECECTDNYDCRT